MQVTMITLIKGSRELVYEVANSKEELRTMIHNVQMGYEEIMTLENVIRVLPKYETINGLRVKQYPIDMLVINPKNYDNIEYIHVVRPVEVDQVEDEVFEDTPKVVEPV